MKLAEKDSPHFTLGSPSGVFYLEPGNIEQSQDVLISARSGKVFGFNRCILAALSNVFYNIFKGLYQCPIANSDERIFISSNLTEAELTTLTMFFNSGKFPSSEEAELFRLLGLDLNLQSGAVSKTVSRTVESSNVVESKFVGIGFESGEMLDKIKKEANFDCYVKVEDVMENELLINNPDPDWEDNAHQQDLDWEDNALATSTRKERKRAATNFETVAIKENKRPRIKIETESKRPRGAKDNANRKKLKRRRPEPQGKESYFYFPQDGERDLSLEFQCGRCTRGFPDRDKYRQHFYRHDMPEPDYSKAFQCMRCLNFQADSYKAVARHGRDECHVKRRDDKNSPFTYFCALCQPGQTFDDIVQLSLHVKKDHNDKVESSVCEACGEKCKDNWVLTKHKQKKGPFHDNKCVTCNKKVKSWQEHQEHVYQVHGGIFKFKCGFCGINVYDTEKDLENHRKLCKFSKAKSQCKVFENGDQQCTVCGDAVETSWFKVKAHMAQFHPQLVETCPMCNEHFEGKRNLENHIKTNHMGQRFECNKCDKVYKTSGGLNLHQSQGCGNARKVFKCDECDKEYASKNGLDDHKLRKHGSGQVPLPKARLRMCELCGKEVTDGNGYRYHMAAYHSTETFKCDQCDMVFKVRAKLVNHKKNVHEFVTCDLCGMTMNHGKYSFHMQSKHTAEDKKAFYCEMCKKGFISKDKFQDHMNIHTGETPHQCHFCERKFKDKSNRNKHIRESHLEQHLLRKQAMANAKQL